jgi:hypothetical protein
MQTVPEQYPDGDTGDKQRHYQIFRLLAHILCLLEIPCSGFSGLEGNNPSPA